MWRLTPMHSFTQFKYSLSLLVFYVTRNDISVIYVTAQMCRRTEDGRPGFQRHRHFARFSNVPVLHRHGTTLFIRRFRQKFWCSQTLGIERGPRDGHVKEPYKMSMAIGARPNVKLLQSACTTMCRHILLKYRWYLCPFDCTTVARSGKAGPLNLRLITPDGWLFALRPSWYEKSP